MFPGLFQWSAIHSISCCCNKKMKEKKLIDLLTDMRCCEICVLLLLSFQQMSIKHKKSLFPNITRDDNYHKSIFQISIMCPYCQIPSRRKSAAIRIDGWGTVLRITSQLLCWTCYFYYQITTVSWGIHFQDPNSDFALVIACEESSSFCPFKISI